MNNSNNTNNELNDFFEVCRLKDLPPKKAKHFLVNEVEITLCKIGKTVYALNNICPHQHASIIHNGFIEDDFIVCPAHGWMFNLETGKKKDGSNGLTTYPVKIKDDIVFVKVFEKKLNW